MNPIPQGYKKTEIGVIPEDWEVLPMSTMTTLMTNGFVGVAKTSYTEANNGVLYIQGYNVLENGFNFHGIKKITPEFHKKNSKSCLESGDVLTVQTGDVGLTTIIPPNLAGSNCHALIISRFKKDKFNPYFFSFYLNSQQGRLRLKELETGTTMKHINVGDLIHFELPAPPKPEQTAIATALSDVDALITGLESLIAKKQAIKTATMQQLLTGKTRLPQFAHHPDGTPKGTQQRELGEIPEDWNIHALGSLCGYQNGKAQEQYFNSNDGYKVISIGNYSESGRYIETGSYIDKQFKNEVGRFVLSRDDLTMILNDKTAVGTIIGRVLLIEVDDTYVMNQRTMRLTPKDGVESKYLHFLINSDSVHKRIVGMAKPGTQIYVNTDDVLEFNLLVPNSQDEQTAIATILSDMDEEIQTLQTRLSKTQQIKQGMMQQLLTGKVRLIKGENYD